MTDKTTHSKALGDDEVPTVGDTTNTEVQAPVGPLQPQIDPSPKGPPPEVGPQDIDQPTPPDVEPPIDTSQADISNIDYEIISTVNDPYNPKSLVNYEIKLKTKDEGLDLGTINVQQALDGLTVETLESAIDNAGKEAARGAVSNPNFDVMQEIAKRQKKDDGSEIAQLAIKLDTIVGLLTDLNTKADKVQQDQETLGAWVQAIYTEVTS